MPNTHVRLLIAICALIAMLLGTSAAQASPIESCPGFPGGINQTSICSYVTNRVLVFGDQPGVLAEGSINRTGAHAVTGDAYGSSINSAIPYNAAAWNFFGSEHQVHGVSTFSTDISALKGASVRVVADYSEFMGDTHERPYGLSCNAVTFLVCTTPAVWMKNRDYSWYQPLKMIEGVASIETRPLVVKVLNMTDQPLLRSGSVYTNHVRRDEQIHDPETIAAGTDGRTAAGYYHFYRNTAENDTVSINYTFTDGAGATSLTGQEIGIDIKVGSDGSTDASSCTTPTGGNTTIECSVNVLGLADGILEAVVVVGV